MNLSITLEQPDKKLALFGSADRHLRMIRDTFGVQIVNRDDELRLAGERDQVGKAAAVLEQMQKKLRRQPRQPRPPSRQRRSLSLPPRNRRQQPRHPAGTGKVQTALLR